MVCNICILAKVIKLIGLYPEPSYSKIFKNLELIYVCQIPYREKLDYFTRNQSVQTYHFIHNYFEKYIVE